MRFSKQTEGAEGQREETFHVLVRKAEEGGFWGEVVELPGCASQGESIEELLDNVIDAIQGVLAVHYEDEGRHEPKTYLTMSVKVPVPG